MKLTDRHLAGQIEPAAPPVKPPPPAAITPANPAALFLDRFGTETTGRPASSRLAG